MPTDILPDVVVIAMHGHKNLYFKNRPMQYLYSIHPYKMMASSLLIDV